MICSTCHEPIERDASIAVGRDGTSHAKCAKRATAHGKELTIIAAFEEIDRLKRRVQELERTVASHDRSIDFKVG